MYFFVLWVFFRKQVGSFHFGLLSLAFFPWVETVDTNMTNYVCTKYFSSITYTTTTTTKKVWSTLSWGKSQRNRKHKIFMSISVNDPREHDPFKVLCNLWHHYIILILKVDSIGKVKEELQVALHVLRLEAVKP